MIYTHVSPLMFSGGWRPIEGFYCSIERMYVTICQESENAVTSRRWTISSQISVLSGILHVRLLPHNNV